MTKGQKRVRTEWQRVVRTGLRAVAAAYPANLTIVAEHGLDEDGADRTTIRFPTGDLQAAPGGLPVNAFEDVLLRVEPTPLVPPLAIVEHERFAGHPHVLQGQRLCVYLDEAREWNPNGGITGFLEQLWQWFADAVAGRFDPTLALYHPVGGVLHQTEGTPMVVVRDPFPDITKPFHRAELRQRTDCRLDLTWGMSEREDRGLAAVVLVPAALRYGAGTTLLGLLGAIARVGHPQPEAVLRSFAGTACRNAEGSPLYFVLAVRSGAGVHHHLVVGRLPGEVADVLRKVGTVRDIDPSSIPPEIAIEWCSVSDERPEITMRRDADRPVNAFAGKKVHVWGCGGIGSWMAEFIARAGPARIVVCDPALVGGGLLVRQNFAENDLGMKKADALAARLRALGDGLEVEAASGLVSASHGDGLLPDCDILIDATVSVAIGVLLDAAARASNGPRPLIAQVATDVRTGSLGIMTVAGPGYPAGPATADHAVGGLVLANGGLEQFHCLWQEPAPGDEIIPARGCSTPTFHGSAADLAAISGVLVSLLGPHLGTPGPGTHLLALPHAAEGPAHRFIPAPRAQA